MTGIVYRVDPHVIAITHRSRSSLYNDIRDGKLKTFKLGRHRLVRRADLAAYLGIPERDLVDASVKSDGAS